jgi:hypothetical protein
MSKTTVKDPWCQLAGGYKCYLDSPRDSLPFREIVAEILPQSLSKICRFGAQIQEHYSLAQHVCGVQSWVKAAGGTIAQQLQALLHDGAEGILGGDIPKPVREKILLYDDMEERFLDQIMRLYLLPTVVDDLVWDGDVRLLVIEGEKFLEGGPIDQWTNRYAPPDVDRAKIIIDAFGALDNFNQPWTIVRSKEIFTARLAALTREHLHNEQKKLLSDREQ